MKKILFSVFSIFIAVNSYAQCEVVSGIDENFDSWGDTVDECWGTISEGAIIYPAEGILTFYSLFAPNTNTMLVTPEIEQGTYELNFDAVVSEEGTTTEGLQIQVGTLTNPSDASTFVAVGDPFSVTTTDATYTLDVALEEGQYIAFNAVIPAVHSAIFLDNISLQAQTAGVSDVNGLDVQIYPNPVVDQLNFTSKERIKQVTIFSLSGQLMSSHTVNAVSTSVNVSNLKTGVYIAQIQTEKGTKTVKVVKK